MSDFDFDELDKAVNGAIGDDTPTTPAAPASQPSAQLGSSIDAAPVQPAQAARETLIPAARRGPSGRFMDVVHPSSDMRTRTNAAPTRFSPPTTTSTPASSPVAPAMPDPTPAPTQESEFSLDFEALNEPAELSSNNPAAGTVVSTPWQKPLESPFLPDAKVEKRPLGAPEASQPFPSFEPMDAALAEETPQEPEAPFFQEPALDLLEEPEEELKLEAPDEPLLEATTLPDPIDFASQHTTHLETDDTAVGPIAITQQYKEQPSSAKESGPMYDTEAYHQPLTVAPKKHSGWWVFLWIFLLIVFGAGAGVLIYLYVLPLI